MSSLIKGNPFKKKNNKVEKILNKCKNRKNKKITFQNDSNKKTVMMN